jgi:quercetin dioxygenase-like cupin family protein
VVIGDAWRLSMRTMLTLWLLLVGVDVQAQTPAVAPHKVMQVTDAPARTVGGKATVWRLAGKEEGAQSAFFAVLELAPGAKVPVHRDATEEYIYILQGTGQITIDGVQHSLKAGSGVFMPANAEVSFVATGDAPVRAVQFFAGQGPEAKYEGWAVVPAADKK